MEPTQVFESLTMFDIVTLSFLLIGILIGLLYGFTQELSGINAFIFSLFITLRIYPLAIPFLEQHIEQKTWVGAIAFILVLFLSLLALHYIARLFNLLCKLSIFSLLNKFIGGLLGGVKVLLLAALFASIWSYFLPSSTLLANSTIIPYLKPFIDIITTVQKSLLG